MKFEQIENLSLNRELDRFMQEHKEFETREDVIAYAIRKVIFPEQPKQETVKKDTTWFKKK
jgi:hypothetical protein